MRQRAGNGTDPVIPRRSRMFGTIIALTLSAPFSAQANAVCDALRAQLNQPTRTIANTAEIRQYANALTQQSIVIRRIRNDMRTYGCSSGSIIRYGNPNAGLCAEIGNALTQAQAERDMIAEDRDRMLAMQRNERGDDQRQRIMAALDAEGCSDEQPPGYASKDADQPPQMRGYSDPFNEPDRQQYAPPLNMPMEGGLRTLCVRTCDGAFFPISSNATPLDFRAQAAQCERMCPGTETELFYHSLQGQESSDMVSARTGQPYTSMPTAFAYRNASPSNRSPSCTCNMAAYHNDMKKLEQQEAKAPQSDATQPFSSITTIPSMSNAPTQEAEAQVKVQPVPERDYDPKNSRVRTVGPQFLPEETSRIDLKNPALKGAQPQQE